VWTRDSEREGEESGMGMLAIGDVTTATEEEAEEYVKGRKKRNGKRKWLGSDFQQHFHRRKK